MKQSEIQTLEKLYKKYERQRSTKISRVRLAQISSNKHNGRPRKSKWTDTVMRQAVHYYVSNRSTSVRKVAIKYEVPAGSLYYHIRKYKFKESEAPSAII